MKSEWVTIPLGDVLTLQRGHDLPTQNRLSGDIPILGSSGITGFHNEAKATGPGVTVGRSGNSMGEISYSDKDFWPLNTALYVTDFKGNDPKFIYYLLKTIDFDQFNSGSAQKSLNRNAVYPFEVEIPKSRAEQQRISSVLSSLEEKVGINQKINQTLEQMSQAIFKSWFVNFEPVKAKIASLEAGESEEDALLAAMQAISGTSLCNAGASAAGAHAALTRLQAEQPERYAELRATAELFPSAMQDSELGEIPEGWAYGTLSDIASFSRQRISKDELTLETYISTENMLENRKGVCPASSFPSSASVPGFEPGEILISNIRPYFKKIWLANIHGGRSPDVLGFTPRHNGTEEHLFNLLYQDSFFEYMMLTSKGAKMPRGDKKAIMQFATAVPPIDLMRHFSEHVRPFYLLATSHNRESVSLVSIRDTILPKLLSGELSVSSAEDQPAEAMETANV
ncbi:restriction endonuclease subunit S [Marinobacter lacisalsi]|uniref:Restriction endonuclease subunit S n=1 Tax=Marinobacter lacisalsi TaxID=475979 RepID=A0ABV8QMA1_9GAMM